MWDIEPKCHLGELERKKGRASNASTLVQGGGSTVATV